MAVVSRLAVSRIFICLKGESKQLRPGASFFLKILLQAPSSPICPSTLSLAIQRLRRVHPVCLLGPSFYTKLHAQRNEVSETIVRNGDQVRSSRVVR